MPGRANEKLRVVELLEEGGFVIVAVKVGVVVFWLEVLGGTGDEFDPLLEVDVGVLGELAVVFPVEGEQVEVVIPLTVNVRFVPRVLLFATIAK